MYRFRSAFVALALMVGVLGLSAVGAQAKTPAKPKHVFFTGGQVTLTPSPSVLAFLKAHHVRVTAVGKAKLEDGALVLPVRAGVADAEHMTGVISLEGGVRFTWDKKTFTIRDMTVSRFPEKTLLSGTVNDVPMVLGRIAGSINAANGKATSTGALDLTPAAAQWASKKFGKADLFAAGTDLGTYSAVLTLKS